MIAADGLGDGKFHLTPVREHTPLAFVQETLGFESELFENVVFRLIGRPILVDRTLGVVTPLVRRPAHLLHERTKVGKKNRAAQMVGRSLSCLFVGAVLLLVTSSVLNVIFRIEVLFCFVYMYFIVL